MSKPWANVPTYYTSFPSWKCFFFCGEPYEKLNCFTKTGDDDQVDNEVAGSSDKYSKVYFLLFLHLFVRLCALLVWLMMMMMTMMAKKKQGQSPNFLAKYSVLGKTFLLKFHFKRGSTSTRTTVSTLHTRLLCTKKLLE